MQGNGTHPARLLVALLGAALAVLLLPAQASAHTEFDGSSPTDGAVVAAPLDRVVVSFTEPATASGDGIVLFDADGARVEASLEGDETDFVLVPVTPLGPGTYGVAWEVRAGDAHPIDGTFSFVVSPTATGGPETPSTDGSPTGTAPPASLDEALDASGTSAWAGSVRAVSRVLVTAGAMLALGGLAALLTCIRGSEADLRAVLTWVRAAGATVAVGGALRLWVLTTTMPGLAEVREAPLATASVLRVAGGIALVLGLPTTSLLGGRRGRRGATTHADHRWTRGWPSVLGFLGAGLVLIAFWFDGHTASVGPVALHVGINAVHVAAGAAWSGGVLVIAALLWRRHRRGEGEDGAWLVARFSRLAGAALAAVVLAGVALAVVILDSPSELWSTAWGLLLLVKTAVVAVAAALGALMHLRLRPALMRDPDDQALAVRVRRSFAAESAAFVAVIALTAWLVGAMT
ncbi:CopD family protein [uncultured Phycicoccus sp.]|uniref:copper resistance CopC/CopD family protein n=1 Tax=uncultured Phycicoccus sp. TaxID=661422 RepID=UPI002623AD64|nr:CopD family protein [uncultured Phycicoccus sp.]